MNKALTGEGTRTVRRYSALLLAAGAGTGAAVMALVLLTHAAGVESAQLAARLTARTSALWFLLAFSAGPLARLLRAPWTRALLRERRGIGLGFFAAHTVHLSAIGLVVARGGEMDVVAAIGGGLAYALMFAMAASSNDPAVAWLGMRRWQRLHTIGIWYLWIIFAQSYVGRLAGAQPAAAHYLMVALVLGAMGLRIAARFRREVTVAP